MSHRFLILLIALLITSCGGSTEESPIQSTPGSGPQAKWNDASVLPGIGSLDFWPPLLARTSNNQTLAVWLQQNTWDRTDAYSALHTHNNGWSEPIRIEDDDTKTYVDYLTVSSNANGNIFSIWYQTHFSSASKWAINYYHPEAGWQGDTTVPMVPINFHSGCKLSSTMDNQGVVTLLYETLEGIKSIDYNPSVGWGSEQNIPHSKLGSIQECTLFTSEQDGIYSVWWDEHESPSSLLISHYNKHSGWDTPITLVQKDHYFRSPIKVTTDQKGNIYVLWADTRYDDQSQFEQLWLTQLDTLNDAIQSSLIREATDIGASNHVFTDNDGNVVISWTELQPSTNIAWTTLNPETGIVPIQVTPYSASYLRFSSTGNYAIATGITSSYENGSRLYSNLYVSGEGWGYPQLVFSSSEVDSLGYFTASINEQGSGVGIWKIRERSNNRWGSSTFSLAE